MTLQYKRLSKAALGTTVTVMFFGIRFALLHQKELLTMPLPTTLFTGVGVGITSVGTYQLLLAGFFFLFSKQQFLRRWVLGSSYIEGTWVGHYVHDGKKLYTIEHINQSHEETTIHGWEFDEAGQKSGSWTSHVLSIDGDKKSLGGVFANPQ